MCTSWEEIEVRAMTYIKNDISLEWDRENRLPVFFNRLWAYMREAIPAFNRPPEMLMKLADYTAPQFETVSAEISAGESDVTIQTGLQGFDTVSAGYISTDSVGDVQYTSAEFLYNAESGDVTITGPTEGGTIEIDLYKSGSFSATLNESEKGILAFAIYNRYEHRFDNDVLERQAKIRDSAFTTISEASQTTAGTSRQREVDRQFFDMMRAYQDNLEYLSVVKNIGLV